MDLFFSSLPERLHQGYPATCWCSRGLMAQTQRVFTSSGSTEDCNSSSFITAIYTWKSSPSLPLFFCAGLSKPMFLDRTGKFQPLCTWVHPKHEWAVSELKYFHLPPLHHCRIHDPCVSFLCLPKRFGSLPILPVLGNATKDSWNSQWKCFPGAVQLNTKD